ncbi:MAG TPA: DinB family protein [Candidatus Acidoferrales bacterium]|nr:DinB family protein [Candidatus Acidoferrales bacterium]
MKTKIYRMFSAAAGLAVGLSCAPAAAALPAHGAAAPQQTRPAATTNPNEGFLRTWKDVAQKITDMAEDFPEDKYDFKPNPDVRTFAEQVLHVTSSVYYFQAILEGKNPTEEGPKRSDFKSKAEIVAYAKKALADGTALLEKADFSKLIQRPKRPLNPYALWSDFCEHAGEHYGQMVVYYRVNGLVPPESRPKK